MTISGTLFTTFNNYEVDGKTIKYIMFIIILKSFHCYTNSAYVSRPDSKFD